MTKRNSRAFSPGSGSDQFVEANEMFNPFDINKTMI